MPLFNGISISELLELQKLRKSGAGIDITKLNKGATKKKPKKVVEEDKVEYGLRPGAAEESVHGSSHVLTWLMGWLLVTKEKSKPEES